MRFTWTPSACFLTSRSENLATRLIVFNDEGFNVDVIPAFSIALNMAA